MKDAKEHLEEALSSSRFDIGGYIDDGFSIWKKGAGSFIGFALIVAVISLVLAFIPFIGTLLSSLFVSSCLTLGAYYVSQRIDDGEGYSFENFFDGFQSIGEVCVMNLIIFVISIFLIIPFIIMVGVPFVQTLYLEDYSALSFETFSFWSFLTLLPLIYASLLIAFALPILGFYKVSSWEAIQYSARFCHKHWILLFLFYILIGIIVSLGLLALIIGIFVTMSFVYPMMYAAFKDLTDWEGYNSDELSDPDVDTLDYFR